MRIEVAHVLFFSDLLKTVMAEIEQAHVKIQSESVTGKNFDVQVGAYIGLFHCNICVNKNSGQ